MTRLLRDIRLVPIVLMAIICLFALKTFGLIFDGGYTLNESAARNAEGRDITGAIGPAKDAAKDAAKEAARRAEAKRADAVRAEMSKTPPKRSWAQQMFNYPDVTGAVGEDKSPPDAAAKDNGAAAKDNGAVKAPETPPPPVAAPAPRERLPSPAERAILERLAERRAELDARAREVEMRESLLLAAEKRLEARITELKEIEARVNTAAQVKSEGEATKFKNIVTMYENMKAKDAAKIFDRLDLRVLVDVAHQLNPRRMSDIMAQMVPEAAERLTLELAARAKDKPATDELPKIEGRPGAN